MKLFLSLLQSRRLHDHLKGALITIMILIGGLYYLHHENYNKFKTKAEVDFYANKTQKSTGDRFTEYLDTTKTNVQYVYLDGQKMAYSLLQQDNQKFSTTVIIIGGLPGIDIHWAELANRIKDRANVVVIHPLGYLPSDGIRTTDNIVNSANKAVREVNSKHGLWDTRLVLMGESMGGNIISHVSQNIASDVLILQKPMPSTSQAAGYSIVKKDGAKEDTLPYLMYEFLGSPRLDKMLPKSQAKNIFINIGQNDTIVDPIDQTKAFQTILDRPNAHLRVDLDGDHWSIDYDTLINQIFGDNEISTEIGPEL